MPKPLACGYLSTSRPVDGALARTDAPSRAAGRATSCLQLAAPAGDARRRSRVHDALAAGQLTIRSERYDCSHVVAVFGELDIATTERVEDALRTVEATDVKRLGLRPGPPQIQRVRAFARADALPFAA